MSNNGTSFKFVIDGTQFKQNIYGSIGRYVLQEVNPPSLQNGNRTSQSLLKWVNPYPQIAFQKVIIPYFDGIYKYTTRVSNDPDFIKDYHFISLMRCIDLYNKDIYSGEIVVDHDSPKFTTNDGKNKSYSTNNYSGGNSGNSGNNSGGSSGGNSGNSGNSSGGIGGSGSSGGQEQNTYTFYDQNGNIHTVVIKVT